MRNAAIKTASKWISSNTGDLLTEACNNLRHRSMHVIVIMNVERRIGSMFDND